MTELEQPSVVVDPAAVADPLIGTRLNKIEFIRRLDSGAMGNIYLGVNAELDKQYAIKVASTETDPAVEGRSLQEAKALSKLDHPNIVPVYDAWTLPDGRLAIVMPLLSGTSLLKHIDQRPDGSSRPLGVREAVFIGLQLAAGLDDAHRHGLVHRDLKPGNVFVTQRDVEIAGFKGREVKILDFGLVRMSRAPLLPLRAESAAASGPAPTLAAGTPQYASPEQALGSASLDGRSDLYSLGALLFELITGRLPFVAPATLSHEDQVASFLRQHQEERAPRITVFAPAPIELEALIAQLLEKSPDARPASAKIVEQRLRTILTALPPDAAAPPPPKRSARTLGAGLAVVAAIAALATFILWPEAPAQIPVEAPPAQPPASSSTIPEATPVVVPKAEDPGAAKPEILAAPTTAKMPAKKTHRVRAASEPCTPDDHWRKAMLANLNELGRSMSDNPTRYSKFKARESRLSPLVRTAQTPAECAQANSLFEALKEDVSSR